METSRSRIYFILLFSFLIGLPFILQTVGLFTPYWVKTNYCDSIGLVYSCCSGPNNDTCGNTHGAKELDATVHGLELASFILMIVSIVTLLFNLMYQYCCRREDKAFARLATIIGSVILLFVGGFLSCIGCLLIEKKFEASQLGWSFYLCQACGGFYVFITFVLCGTVFCPFSSLN